MAVEQTRQSLGANAFLAEPFRRALPWVPTNAIVFVCYQNDHQAQFSLVTNSPDLRVPPTWVAYDGGDDARLLHLAPDRLPFRYLGAQYSFVPLVGESTVRTTS